VIAHEVPAGGGGDPHAYPEVSQRFPRRATRTQASPLSGAEPRRGATRSPVPVALEARSVFVCRPLCARVHGPAMARRLLYNVQVNPSKGEAAAPNPAEVAVDAPSEAPPPTPRRPTAVPPPPPRTIALPPARPTPTLRGRIHCFGDQPLEITDSLKGYRRQVGLRVLLKRGSLKISLNEITYSKFLRLHFQPYGSTPTTLSRAERGTSHVT